MFFYDCALWSNTELDSVSSTLRYCMTAPRANLEIVRLVARIRRLSSRGFVRIKFSEKCRQPVGPQPSRILFRALVSTSSFYFDKYFFVSILIFYVCIPN